MSAATTYEIITLRGQVSRLQADKERAEAVLNYVADNTYCGRDAEWHFKPGYDPQRVLDALQGGDEGKGEEPEDRDPADDGDDAWFHDSDMGAR